MKSSSEAEQLRLLNRREAIRCVSAMLGGVLAGGSSLLAVLETAGAATAEIPGDFTAEQMAFLDEIAETILPATKTPGAKAAKVGAFMALMVTDAYSPEEQKAFRQGMQQVEATMRRTHGVSFVEATSEQRLALITMLDRELMHLRDAREALRHETDTDPPHYFRMMKELVLLGFFTSEIGCTQVQRFLETPGRFDPCIPYQPGEPAWALHA